MEKLLRNFLEITDERESKLVSHSPTKHKIVALGGIAVGLGRTEITYTAYPGLVFR